jgi:hypothetical protein
MKKKMHASRRDESPKKVRKAARKCPCCGAAPCSCEKNCFCQELKGELAEDESEAELEGARLEDDLQFSFLRYGEQSA